MIGAAPTGGVGNGLSGG